MTGIPLNTSEHFEKHTLNSYQVHHMDRTSTSGGVVNNKLTCKVLQPMSTTIDNILECLTVELSLANHKNIIISTWYRKPGIKHTETR